jgi:hypothetical protein
MRWSLLMLTSILWLTACGSTPAPVQSADPANLSGNWLIFGSLPTSAINVTRVPGLAITIDVKGTTLTVSAAFNALCSSGTSAGLLTQGIINSLSGTVAADGSFSIGSESFGVKGVVPSAIGLAWAGTYSLIGNNPSCNFNQSGSITATAVQEIVGTYTATGSFQYGSGAGVAAGSPVTITPVLQQGATFYDQINTPAYSNLALGGTLHVIGFSCFTHGTLSTSLASEVFGSEFTANYVMDDGSQLTLNGNIVDPTSARLVLTVLFVNSGPCGGVYNFGYSPLIVQRQ